MTKQTLNISQYYVKKGESVNTDKITDANAHARLGTLANATQDTINTAIDAKIGALLDIELIEVVDEKPTASASTMNKLYLVAEPSAKTDDAYEIFVTVRTGANSYDWEKVDTARINLSDYLTVSEADNVYQQKGDYLTASDISGKEDISNKSYSIATDTGSTTKYPTVEAVESYAQPKGNYSTKQDVENALYTIDVIDVNDLYEYFENNPSYDYDFMAYANQSTKQNFLNATGKTLEELLEFYIHSNQVENHYNLQQDQFQDLS